MPHSIQHNNGGVSCNQRRCVCSETVEKTTQQLNGRIHTGEDESSNKIAEEESSHKTTK